MKLIPSCCVNLLLVAACGGAQSPGTLPERPGQQSAETLANPAAGEPGGPGIPWPDKTRAQKMEYMGLVVYPQMKQVFQAYDTASFQDFRCQTCHGEDMEAVDFEMPNSPYALSASDPMASALDYDSKLTRFMAETVVPEMARLLGKAPYDPETQAGLGCFASHQQEEPQ